MKRVIINNFLVLYGSKYLYFRHECHLSRHRRGTSLSRHKRLGCFCRHPDDSFVGKLCRDRGWRISCLEWLQFQEIRIVCCMQKAALRAAFCFMFKALWGDMIYHITLTEHSIFCQAPFLYHFQAPVVRLAKSQPFQNQVLSPRHSSGVSFQP